MFNTTGCFRVRVKIHLPPISVVDDLILKSFGVVIATTGRFCFVYLDGLHVGNYPSKTCRDFWTDFRPLRNIPEIRHLSSVPAAELAPPSKLCRGHIA